MQNDETFSRSADLLLIEEVEASTAASLEGQKNVGVKTNLNATAYRIFRILQWLDEEPLSVEELNARFYREPLIQKRLSNDSIWLYINTLKALGCRISRPAPSTDYRYVLLHHPFGFLLSQSDQKALAKVKQQMMEAFSAEDILVFDVLMKKILKRAAFSRSPQELEQYIGEVFRKSRTVDYEEKQGLIAFLQESLQRGVLLSVGYDSVVRGQELIELLPVGLVYENGVLYLRGFRQESPEPCSLRVERLLQVHELDNEPLRRVLEEKRQTLPKVVCRLYFYEIRDYEPMDLGEQSELVQGDLSDDPQAPPGAVAYVRVSLHTRDFFQLRQKLLSSGCPFYIEEPTAFRQDVLESLQAMSQLYGDCSDED